MPSLPISLIELWSRRLTGRIPHVLIGCDNISPNNFTASWVGLNTLIDAGVHDTSRVGMIRNAKISRRFGGPTSRPHDIRVSFIIYGCNGFYVGKVKSVRLVSASFLTMRGIIEYLCISHVASSQSPPHSFPFFLFLLLPLSSNPPPMAFPHNSA